MALKDRYLTISEAAKELAVSRQTIYRWIADNKISAEKIGGLVLINKKAIQEYKRKMSTKSWVTWMDDFVMNSIRQKQGYTDMDKMERLPNEGKNVIYLVTREDGIREKVKIGSIQIILDLDVGQDVVPEKATVEMKDVIVTKYEASEYKEARRGRKTK